MVKGTQNQNHTYQDWSSGDNPFSLLTSTSQPSSLGLMQKYLPASYNCKHNRAQANLSSKILDGIVLPHFEAFYTKHASTEEGFCPAVRRENAGKIRSS